MKKALYPKLAWTGMRKNGKLYVPYIFICICMIMIYVIIVTLINDSNVSKMRGSDILLSILGLGLWVLALFSLIFLFYTNSSIMKKRRKELGLYNVLGMGKFNIALILLWENIITALISLAGGISIGTLLARLAEAGLAYILHEEPGYGMLISYKAIWYSFGMFGTIFLLIFLNSIRQIKYSNPAALMKSENMGERPPKGNWLVGISGAVLLGAAYYIAITIDDPIAALGWFFVAVLMVIVATYAIFISGSVLLCRILRYKKSYYYKAKHFVSVSQMSYRMKRNGAGLASICIICTMVLVMLASSVCLYIGTEHAINIRYPRPVTIYMNLDAEDVEADSKTNTVRDMIEDIADSENIEISSELAYRSMCISACIMENGTIKSMADISGGNIHGTAYSVYFVPLEDYNRSAGKSESLADNEALIYAYRSDFNKKVITVENGESYNVRKTDAFPLNGEMTSNAAENALIIIVNDIKNCASPFYDKADFKGNRALKGKWFLGFSTDAGNTREAELAHDIQSLIGAEDISERTGLNIQQAYAETRESNKAEYYSITGGLLFIGILLSGVFLIAGVIIMYYKQVSEGYEDKSRFGIMKNVGMTDRDIRKSINSQMLTVFILPPAASVVHLFFAFPLISKLLVLLSFSDTKLLLLTTAGSCVLVFVLLYMIVYKITSNAYYAIVKK